MVYSLKKEKKIDQASPIVMEPVLSDEDDETSSKSSSSEESSKSSSFEQSPMPGISNLFQFRFNLFETEETLQVNHDHVYSFSSDGDDESMSLEGESCASTIDGTVVAPDQPPPKELEIRSSPSLSSNNSELFNSLFSSQEHFFQQDTEPKPKTEKTKKGFRLFRRRAKKGKINNGESLEENEVEGVFPVDWSQVEKFSPSNPKGKKDKQKRFRNVTQRKKPISKPKTNGYTSFGGKSAKTDRTSKTSYEQRSDVEEERQGGLGSVGGRVFGCGASFVQLEERDFIHSLTSRPTRPESQSPQDAAPVDLSSNKPERLKSLNCMRGDASYVSKTSRVPERGHETVSLQSVDSALSRTSKRIAETRKRRELDKCREVDIWGELDTIYSRTSADDLFSLGTLNAF